MNLEPPWEKNWGWAGSNFFAGCRLAGQIIRHALPEIAEYPVSCKKSDSAQPYLFFQGGSRFILFYFYSERRA